MVEKVHLSFFPFTDFTIGILTLSDIIPVFTFALTSKGQPKGTARETQVVLCLLRGMMRGMYKYFNKLQTTAPHSSSSPTRFVQIGVASFGSTLTCASSPGGFSRLNYDVLQWIRSVKVSFI